MTPLVVLTVAGSDPSGGAGVQADLRTFSALGAHGTSVLAALTVQDTTAVHRVEPVDAELVAAQLDRVTADVPPAASKTGLLAGAPNIEVVAAAAAAGRLGPLVVDPVLRASTGAALTPADLADAYRRRLLPLAAAVTPNLAEAEWLTGRTVADLAGMRAAALDLCQLGVGVAVVTGGHLPGPEEAADVVAWDDSVETVSHPRITTSNTHGTGCTFSAALTVLLARGLEARQAVEEAGRFVLRALEGARDWHLGAGPGPLDQLGAAPPGTVPAEGGGPLGKK